LAKIVPKPNGNTALYRTIVAGYKYMKQTYKPDMMNSILLLTDGMNDEGSPGAGPTLKATLATLAKLSDPQRPIQVIMIGFGKGVDPKELNAIAGVTQGGAYVAYTPQQVQDIFLQAISKRICAPKCSN
ncbi:MAG TPA: hypothetical protein VNW94_17680, partial [Streptosporangiaceae bacterium]|nr:hypothetical protein [Streptosporangiaceae bacterium]